MKRTLLIFVSLCLSTILFAQINASVAGFRDAMYDDPLNHETLLSHYNSTKEEIQKTLTGYDLYVELARCEYFMGRSYLYGEKKDSAGQYFDKGIEYAKKALEIKEDVDALVMLAENISQNCAVKPTSYALSNGLSIAGYAKDALKINENSAAALYLIAAQNIYAPSPFSNHKKGIREMTKILEMPLLEMENDDEFNLTSSIAFGHIQRKEFDEGLPWIEKALLVYPNNFFALGLKDQIIKNR